MKLAELVVPLGRLRISGVFVTLLASSISHGSECSVYLPEATDLPASMQSPEGFIWVGTKDLAARVPSNGHWTAMGAAYDFRDKWWWWREGYQAMSESQPELTVTARRLDESAPSVSISDATSALFRTRDLMLLMVEFPTEGCWEVVGKYRNQELRFVFEVGG